MGVLSDAPFPLYGRLLLSPGCGLGEGQVAPVFAKVVARVISSVKLYDFNTFSLKDAFGLLAAKTAILCRVASDLKSAMIPRCQKISLLPFTDHCSDSAKSALAQNDHKKSKKRKRETEEVYATDHESWVLTTGIFFYMFSASVFASILAQTFPDFRAKDSNDLPSDF